MLGIKGNFCHFILDRRFCDHLSTDLIHWSNGLRFREQNFDVRLIYVLMVSTSRCFEFGGELTLGSSYQKHAAQYNKSSRVVVCVMGRELCFGRVLRKILISSFSRPSISSRYDNDLLDCEAEGNTIFRNVVKRYWRHSVTSQKNRIFNLLRWCLFERLLQLYIGCLFACLTDYRQRVDLMSFYQIF